MTRLYLETLHANISYAFGEPCAPFLVPQLETLSLHCTHSPLYVNGPDRDRTAQFLESNKENLIQALDMRSKQPGIQRLRHLIISASFMNDEARERQEYGEYVDEVTVDYS